MVTHEVLDATIDTRREKYLASALLLGSYLLVTGIAYAVGPYIKECLSDDAAEALQAGLMTLLGVVGGVALVMVWDAEYAVDQAIGVVRPTPEKGVKLLVGLLAFGLAYTATRVTKRIVRLGEGRDAISNHQREILHHVVQIAVFLPAVLFSLALFGVSVSNLLLSAGAASLVLGLAARQTLAAVLAGFILLFSRPFEVGDWVEIDDNEGIVTDVSIVNTHLRTFDDEQVLIPNDQITESAVVNRSRNDRLRVQVDVGVDYDTDVGRAADVAVEAMEGVDEIMDGRPPSVVVKRFGDSAVVLNLRFWIKHPTVKRKWDAQNAVIEAVKEAFEREGIQIPFPQRVLKGREEAGGLRVTADDEFAASSADGETDASENGQGEGVEDEQLERATEEGDDD